MASLFNGGGKASFFESAYEILVLIAYLVGLEAHILASAFIYMYKTACLHRLFWAFAAPIWG